MKRVRVDEVRPVRRLLHEGELIVTLARVVAETESCGDLRNG